jgi:hypothetical protein
LGSVGSQLISIKHRGMTFVKKGKTEYVLRWYIPIDSTVTQHHNTINQATSFILFKAIMRHYLFKHYQSPRMQLSVTQNALIMEALYFFSCRIFVWILHVLCTCIDLYEYLVPKWLFCWKCKYFLEDIADFIVPL